MNLKKALLATAVSAILCEEAGVQNSASSSAAATAPAVADTGPIKKVNQKFHFKKDKLGVKRETLSLDLNYPTLDGVINALADPKQAEFIIDVLSDEIYKAARLQVGDETKPVNKQEELDESKLTLEFLANQPKAERTGGGISKEIWEEFAKDYVEVMPAATGKSADQVSNAAKLLLAKFQPVKTNKKVIAFLQEQLALWFSSTPNAEDYTECFDFLNEKAKTLLAADEASLLANL